METAYYLEACAGFTPMEALLTWANGSSDNMNPQKCTVLTFGEAAYARLALPLFEPLPSIDPGVMIERKCEVMAPCPELTTCVLAPMRFDKALAARRNAHGIARHFTVSSYFPSAAVDDFLTNFVPQVLVTDTRAEAHIVG